MFGWFSRPIGRLFLFLPLLAAVAMWGQGLPLTTVQEVRWSDSGWGPGNERNLIGRFTTQTFTVARLSRVQDCYLRQYDNSSPPKYSRYTTALHIDLPLDYSQ
jgi:hypothetical protein